LLNLSCSGAVACPVTLGHEADRQQQDVSTLSRDTEHAANGLSPRFDKEKEQRRLQEAQLIGETGTLVGDIARTEGDLAGLERAKKAHPDYSNDELRKTEEYKSAMKKYGTGSDIQQAISAATAAVQGLAGGDLKAAIAGGAAPYLAEVIHNRTKDASGEVNISANLMAHAVLGAVVASAQGNSALAGASGGALGEYIAQQIYPGVPRDKLTEEQKQTIRALGTLAAGLAGGLTGGSTADAVAGAQAGKNAVENNYLKTDMYSLDRKIKNAKEKGEDIAPILEEARQKAEKDREAQASACKARPDKCAFGRDVANDAYNDFLENGFLQGIDPDVANFVQQETAKDNAVIDQYASEFGKDLAVASEGLSILAGMGTSAALNVFKTGGTIKDSKTGSTVTVYRVEGAPNTRVLIGEQGQVTIIGNTTLYLNFGDKARAQEFLQKRISQNMDGATIKTFEVPSSVLTDLRKNAVSESEVKNYPNRPIIADPTKAPDQYGIRPDQIRDLQDKIIKGSGQNGDNK
jgi:filamentous hemagglutinin